MHVLHCLVSTNQYLEQTDRKFNLINKTSSIFFLNLMIREGAENTENQDFKLMNMEHRYSFYRNKQTGTHWEGLNIFSYAKILCAQTMVIICI